MTANKESFETRALGKLLLTGEYFVLDGASALAVPVRYGQTLCAEHLPDTNLLFWESRDNDDTAWFKAEFELHGLTPVTCTDGKTAATLADILRACRRQNPAFLPENQGFKVLTRNEFPREWGLGTSSTLIAAVARWAHTDPYVVLFDTLGGSGYDIACAYAGGPLLYRLEDQKPLVEPVVFQPVFAENLGFVYLGKKQDSREGIRRYREHARGNILLREEITRLTGRFLTASSLAELDQAIRDHERLVSQALDLPRAKDLYFNDFWGEVKSLGAWGGDFVLITGERPEKETRAYFSRRGFDIFFPWLEMVL